MNNEQASFSGENIEGPGQRGPKGNPAARGPALCNEQALTETGNGNKLITKNWPVITIAWTVITVIVLITVWLLTCLHAAEAKADRANTRVDNLEVRLIRIENNQDQIKTLLINSRND